MTHVDFAGSIFTGWICEDCLATLDQNGLQAFLQRKAGFHGYLADEVIEKAEALLDLVDLRPMCAKCFEELCDK